MEVVEKEIKREFQLERIIFFSDAVFAIAITLLIIDIRIPFQDNMTNHQLLQDLGNKLPQLFGFVISFFIVAGFWMSHHSLFGYVLRFDRRLMWINIFFLFFIILLPFTTGIFGEYGNLSVATTIYTINVLLAGLMNVLCLRHIAIQKNHLSRGLETHEARRFVYAKTMAIPVWIFICWVIGIITLPQIGDLCLFGLSFTMPVTAKLFKPRQS